MSVLSGRRLRWALSAPYSQAEVQALRDTCEQLADDFRAVADLVGALRTALVGAGIVKGGAWVGPAAT